MKKHLLVIGGQTFPRIHHLNKWHEAICRQLHP